MIRFIRVPYLVIDMSGLRSEFSDDGYTPRWGGIVHLAFDNGFGRTDVVTANWSGRDNSRHGEIADFEGESDDATLYAACEAYADTIEHAIVEVLSAPSYWDAHQNDIAYRKANRLPPFVLSHERHV